MRQATAKTNLSWYIFPAGLFLLALFQMAYAIPTRTDILSIWLYFALAFLAYFSILHRFNHAGHHKLNIGLALISRLLLLFCFPLLSDDIYRFIWDGSLILHGIDPFSYTPLELMETGFSWIDPVLFQRMNSPEYFSVYPPVNQFLFMLSAIPGKGNLLASAIIIRFFVLSADLGNIWLIKKLLRFYNKDERLVFLYALNPLVIIEFTGNLHFEAIMIFFSLSAIWLLLNHRWRLAAVAISLGICTKLLPVIFLPLFIPYIGWRNSIYAGLITAVCTIILFLPFLHSLSLVSHFLESLHLYYGKFEFNGSIYQVLKAIGWKWLGYNPIVYTSKILLAFTLIGFLLSYFKAKNIIQGIFWVMFTYTMLSAVVHPWYMLILVAFTPFLKWRFPIVWSLLICLSYYTYHVIPYQEHMSLVLVEYGLVGFYLLYEWRFRIEKPLEKDDVIVKPK